MSAKKAGHLVLYPDRCTQCGQCVRVCAPKAIRVGSGYVYVDADACNGCLECVAVCEPKAVAARSRTLAPAAGSSAKVVVGSRAEAKALRRKTEVAEKSRASSETKSAKVAAFEARRDEQISADGTVAWSLTDAGAALAILLLTFVAKDAALASPAAVLMPDVGRVILRVIVLGLFYAVQVGVLAFIAARHGARLVPAFGLGRMRRGAASAAASGALVAVLLVATRAFSLLYGYAAQSVGLLPPARAEADLARLFGVGWVGMLLSVVLVVAVGPFVEELIFRGVLLRSFEGAFATRFPAAGTWLAIAASSLLFAAYHFTLWLFVPTLVLGLALGWLASSRRSLWPAIALHALYNLVPIIAAFYVAR